MCAPWNYEWGLRLNPGARLNVNGVPTNRVTFARIESIQEMLYPDPFFPFGFPYPSGPLITFKGVFLPTGTMVTPLPEARFHYADFFAPAGDPVHLGPLTQESPSTYDCVAALELDGCDFQAGQVAYEAGGPQGRTVNIHNTIFERTLVSAVDHFQAHGNTEETLTAFNNLFYGCDMWLTPVSGANWTFTDNIFDGTVFHGPQPYLGMGPVANNHHNAYIAMNGARLSPSTQASTDKVLNTLIYDYGDLGYFYIPATATALIRQGSRPAGQAGLYHFTTSVLDTKELNATVTIGPAYLGVINGGVIDSNGDGIPDFIANRRGDGNNNPDEIPWSAPNPGALAILSPLPGSTVTGTIRLRLNPGMNCPAGTHIVAFVDGTAFPGAIGVDNPAQTTAELEVNTTWLPNGTHSFSIRSFPPFGTELAENGPTADSPAVSLTTANAITSPEWQGIAQLAVNVNLRVPSSTGNYTLWFADTSFPKSQGSLDSSSSYSGVAANGAIAFSQPPLTANNSTAFSFTEIPGSGGPDQTATAVANPMIIIDPNYPIIGNWVATYDDAAVDYSRNINNPISDQLDPITSLRWVHDWQLNFGWLPLGLYTGAGGTLAISPWSGEPATYPDPQTWPIRGTLGFYFRGGIDKTFFKKDLEQINQFVADPASRNFYGLGHGNPELFMYFTGAARPIINHRYRFAFLDGCQSFSWQNFTLFGAVLGEVGLPDLPGSDPGGFVDTFFYKMAGLRPAAFVGNVTDATGAYAVGDNGATETDPTTGKRCHLRLLEAMGNWHSELLFYWTQEPYGLADAMNEADISAWEQTDGFFAPNPPDKKYLVVGTDYQGHDITYSPRACLKIAGYRYLHFDQFNHSWDTW